MHLLALILTLLDPGPHAIGTRIDGAQVVWYPAGSGGEIVRFRDYVPRLDDADALLHSLKVPDETIVELFDTRMAARRNAPQKRGRFPVVRIEGRTAAECAVVAELIASHGFVVTTDAHVGARAIRLDEQLTTWRLATDPSKAAARRAAQRLLQSLRSRR